MSIGIKVESCDDRLNTVLKAVCAMSPCHLPIRWAAVNIIVRPNSQICLGKRQWIHILHSISLDANNVFPVPEIQAQLALFESNFERYMLCDGRPGCFTLLIAKLVPHTSAWVRRLHDCELIRRVSPTSHPLSLRLFIVSAQCTYCRGIPVFELVVLRTHYRWDCGGTPFEPVANSPVLR